MGNGMERKDRILELLVPSRQKDVISSCLGKTLNIS